MRILRAPGPFERQRYEQIGRKRVDDRLRRSAGGFAESQRPCPRGLDARPDAFVQDRASKRALDCLEVEPK